MNNPLWHDAKIDKPTTYDPVLVLTSGGYIAIASWNDKKNEWYELASDETYTDVVWWSDFKLPKSWDMSDDYYNNDPYWE